VLEQKAAQAMLKQKRQHPSGVGASMLEHRSSRILFKHSSSMVLLHASGVGAGVREHCLISIVLEHCSSTMLLKPKRRHPCRI